MSTAISVSEFLSKFTEEQMPSATGPWISFDAHNPPFTLKELRTMAKKGVIELEEQRKRYRILLAALQEIGQIKMQSQAEIEQIILGWTKAEQEAARHILQIKKAEEDESTNTQTIALGDPQNAIELEVGHTPMCHFKDASSFTIREIMRWSVMECKDPNIFKNIQKLGTRLKLLITAHHQDPKMPPT